jgi:hypothetical protein
MFLLKNFKKLNSGFAAFYALILILGIICVTTASISFVVNKQQKAVKNVVRSSQSYYSTEAGVEDALLRLRQEMDFSSPYSFEIAENKTATVTISDEEAGTRTINVEGDVFDKIRKVRAVYKISDSGGSFNYGIQVGDGGLTMGNNSFVRGNVFSNGSVIVPTGVAYIDDSVTVARNGNRIDGLIIGMNAKAYSCFDSRILLGDLTYVQGGTLDDCWDLFGDTILQPDEIPAQNLPLTDTQINFWKQEAINGGTISGDLVISDRVQRNLGPLRITGNLTIDNRTTLNMRGTILVSGNLTISNNARIRLDNEVYGSNSGVIIVEGKTTINPNVYLEGSGEDESYLMVLSTNTEISDISNPAIRINNNVNGAIFYAGSGLIVLNNGVMAQEVTAYKVRLENNAWIFYEDGIADITFSSGPSGSWELVSWKEIE